MKKRLLIIYVVIVVAPLALLGGLGARLAHDERAVVQQRFQALLQDRLRETAAVIRQVMEDRERAFLNLPAFMTADPVALDEMSRQSPLVRQYFRLNGENRLAYPAPSAPRNEREGAFLTRTAAIWQKGEVPSAANDGANAAKAASNKSYLQRGWHAWTSADGLGLIFWWRTESGLVCGAELDSVRLLADIIAKLPATSEGSSRDARIALMSEKGSTLYQWGAYEPDAQEAPQARRALDPPLAAWTLAYYAPATAVVAAGTGSMFTLLLSLLALGIALAALAAYFYRENTRELREASQRVTFVNQVSHELKTPLTSIRMYAELLETALDDCDEKPRGYLKVIVEESQRLSRLIENVLTFSRKRRNGLKLHLAMGRMDEALWEIVEQHREALSAKGLQISFAGGADRCVRFDRDVIKQIVGNLLSNTEKYARGGTRVDIASEQQPGRIVITVADDGPGVSLRDRERVFEPFYRVSNALTDGVSGAGIGLAIARSLAELHGGSLSLIPSEQGASFRLEIRAEEGEDA